MTPAADQAAQTTGASVMRGGAWTTLGHIVPQFYVVAISIAGARFLGRSAASSLVFRHIRDHVAALGLRPETVGRLALTAWLHHGRSHVARGHAVRAAGAEPGATTLPHRLARRWLEEGALGSDWDRWRA